MTVSFSRLSKSGFWLSRKNEIKAKRVEDCVQLTWVHCVPSAAGGLRVSKGPCPLNRWRQRLRRLPSPSWHPSLYSVIIFLSSLLKSEWNDLTKAKQFVVSFVSSEQTTLSIVSPNIPSSLMDTDHSLLGNVIISFHNVDWFTKQAPTVHRCSKTCQSFL